MPSRLEAWLAGAADEVGEADFFRIVRLQVAAKLWANHSPLRDRDGQVTAKWFGTAAALRDPSRPSDGRNNRVVGFRPSSIGRLDEWVAYYQELGIACQIDVAASCFTDEVSVALARGGFELQGAARAFAADPRALAPRVHPEVEVEDVTFDRLGDALEVFASGRGEPAVLPELIAARRRELEHSRDSLVSLATVGGEPAAVAGVYFHERAAYLVNAVTLPAKRRRGCQAALLDHRLREAARRGCELVVADTLIGVESQRNVERAGLRPAFSVGWWCCARGLARGPAALQSATPPSVPGHGMDQSGGGQLGTSTPAVGSPPPPAAHTHSF
ncbi:MAG: GNAT family N-acetyltransferase [Myxococcales bacterium]|nr:GNAT family N-acetyltransferase [Myxococcales bacterium]